MSNGLNVAWIWMDDEMTPEEAIRVETLRRVAKVLADFYRAPLSMSSVQPILDLAVELNPELQRSLPGMTFQKKEFGE